MDFTNLQQQSLRIRYEAFSNFASAISKATSPEAVGEAIGIHAKYIFDVFCIRLLYRYSGSATVFDIFRGKVSRSDLQPHTYLCKFEEDLLQKGVPVYMKKEMIAEYPLLRDSIFDHPDIQSIYSLPLRLPEGQDLVITVASKESVPYSELDFRFIKLVAELSSNKLSELLLLSRLGNKNKELEDVNEELVSLNEEIKNLNLHLEEEVNKRTEELTIANHELNTIFYRTSHDFRGPLTTILGLTNLAKHTVSDAAALQLFGHCEGVVLKLDRMLDKLKVLSYSAYETSIPEKVSLKELVCGTLEKLKSTVERKKPDFSIHIKDDQQVLIKRPVLFSILENLIENALIFSPVHSRIEVRIRISKGETIIEVKDEGEGIQKFYQEKVFQMYFKASETSEGNGLGLYVVKRLVDELKGTIQLNTAPGHGTYVKVVLPVS